MFFCFFKKIRIDICLLICIGILYLWNVNTSHFFYCGFLKNHFNDLLAMPAMLSYINIVFVIFKKRFSNNLLYIYLITGICCFAWEFLAIFLKPTSVFDISDIYIYFIGSSIYYILKRGYTR